MKSTELTEQQLKMIPKVYSERQMFTKRDRSDNAVISKGDLVVVRYVSKNEETYDNYTRHYVYKTVTHTFVAIFDSFEKREPEHLSAYHLIHLHGKKISMDRYFADYCELKSVDKLNITKEQFLDDLDKFLKSEEYKREVEEQKYREYQAQLKREEEEKRLKEQKEREELEAQWERERQIEEKRRSEVMSITVGQYEDLLSDLNNLRGELEDLKGSVQYRRIYD